MSDERELIVAKEPSGFWAIRENGRLAITSKSYNEICKAINTYARAYEEHGVAHTISVQAEEEYQERLHHQRIHHEAAIRLIEAEHDDLLEKLLTLVTIAQAGLAKNKPHVTEYQLDRMYDLLGESNA